MCPSLPSSVACLSILEARRPISGIKKGSFGSLLSSAWVAIAGWLHHPAHALSHHNKSCRYVHDRN
ncbi:carbonic anhydrase [Rhizobium sp. rho-13.1]|nr:carbonic anhydrase [Rhizobium sp. rho-13.1]TQY19330.1 carbonic anhydrase [Rhizobium sp. rho-1.1]